MLRVPAIFALQDEGHKAGMLVNRVSLKVKQDMIKNRGGKTFFTVLVQEYFIICDSQVLTFKQFVFIVFKNWFYLQD